MILHHILEIIVLLFLFISFVLKESIDKAINNRKSPRTQQILKVVYWVLMSGVLLTGITKQCIELHFDRLNNRNAEIKLMADDLYYDGARLFREVLQAEPMSYPGLESVILKLNSAAQQYEQLPGQEFKEISSRSAVALSREKLAYATATTSKVYFVEDNSLQYREEHIADDIKAVHAKLRKGEIRCTDVVEKSQWDLARSQHRRVAELILNLRQKQGKKNLDEMTMAARSAGYFFICDWLLFDEDYLGIAKRLFVKISDLCAPNKLNVSDRYKDVQAKLIFLNVIMDKQDAPTDG